MQYVHLTLNAGQARRVQKGGRTWLVAPLTTIVPGVLNGSKGSLLYPIPEIKQSMSQWDRIPITVYHPMAANGQHVSASSPGILRQQGIGYLQNTQWKGKLVHEGWFDEEKLRSVSGDPLASAKRNVLNALQTGQQMELSTGLYTNNVPEEGVHNGKGYKFIAKDYVPDHLAILPDQVGACSLNDGCGLNVNANPEGHNQYTHTNEGKPLHHTTAEELQAHYDNHPEFAKKFEKAYGEAPIGMFGSGHARYIKDALKRKMDVPDHIAEYAKQAMSPLEKQNLKEGLYKPTNNRSGPKEDGCGDGG